MVPGNYYCTRIKKSATRLPYPLRRKRNAQMNPFTDEYFMRMALQEAETAFEKGEIPVGAIIVIDNKVIDRKSVV
mgnify:CR=1 FL=1